MPKRRLLSRKLQPVQPPFAIRHGALVKEEQRMSFTDIVQRKIRERRTGPSPKALAQAARDKRFRLLATQVINALEAMRDRLFEDPLFADVIGRPEVGVEPWNEEGEDGATLHLKGRLATFSILTDIKRDRFSFRIYPDMPTTEALGCSLAGYSPDSGMRGRSTDLNAFITLIEDHIADFLADVATTPAAALLLQTSAATRTDFDGLTRY
jgi:hypothetical protein